MLSGRGSLFVCFKKDGFDVVNDELGVEEASAVDVADVLVGIEKIHFEDVAKEATPFAIILPELGNGLIEVGQDKIEVRL